VLRILIIWLTQKIDWMFESNFQNSFHVFPFIKFSGCGNPLPLGDGRSSRSPFCNITSSRL
jgi:hypothetical protein